MNKKAIFDKKNVLVFGGAGFIGSHLCDELVKDNKVICVDNFITGDQNNINHLLQNPDFKFINHDVINQIDLDKITSLNDYRVEFQGVQAIYFLASPTSPSAYSQKPIETMLANSLGLKNALDLASKYQASFLYASSPAVYGQMDNHDLVVENNVGRLGHLDARSCYAESKRFGEALVANYRLQYNLDLKIARIFNGYGPRMGLGDGRMIPEIIKAAESNQDVIIYGEKDSTGSYLYISDLIKALLKLMSSSEVGPVNIGSDWEIKFEEVADKIIKLIGSRSRIRYQPKNEWLADQLVPDISLAKETIGWFPIVLLDEGLKETINYLSAQRNILGPNAFG